MAYHTYHTDALVLGSTNVGEAHRIIHLFTEELGLIKALARSVRLNKSKLRYNLQRYHTVTVSLIHGKEYWRITGSVEQDNVNGALASRAHVQALSHIAATLHRLVHGEDDCHALYASVQQGLAALKQTPSNEAEIVECIVLLRILYHLGYLDAKDSQLPLVLHDRFDFETKVFVQNEQLRLRKEINQALGASQL